jgi:TRAP transporter TAXI family solute receptor
MKRLVVVVCALHMVLAQGATAPEAVAQTAREPKPTPPAAANRPRGVSAASETPGYKIVTASERGTYIVLGRDLATTVAPDANMDLEALPSAGSAENVRRLRFEPGVKFAIVQSDVYQAFLDQAAAGNKEAGVIIRPLRVILPLYDEEIYWVARADAPFDFIHEVKDARINAGPVGSGTALTALTLYQAIFKTPLPGATTTFLPNEEALLKLTGDKTVDVVVIVGGQPMKLLADMKPEARQLIKFLRVDPSAATSREALRTYYAATVRRSSYPNLLSEDLPSLAVKAFLVTYDYNVRQTQRHLVRFARSLCENLRGLRTHGHPKWKEVQLALPDLPEGWLYYPPTARELSVCIAEHSDAQNAASPGVRASCTPQELVLGLCAKPN